MSRAPQLQPRLEPEQVKVLRRKLYVLTGVTATGLAGLLVACVWAATCANICSDSRSMDKTTKAIAIVGMGLVSALVGTITGYFANRVYSEIFYGGYTSVFCGNTQTVPEGALPEATEDGDASTIYRTDKPLRSK